MKKKMTHEKKAAVKNGVARMIFTILSMLLEVLVILLLIFFAGQKAGWIYTIFHIITAFLVLSIYGSHKTASIRMTWMLVILLLPFFGTALYLLIGLNGHTMKMRKRYDDIDKVLLPMLPRGEDVAARARQRDGRIGGVVDYIRRQAGYPVYDNTQILYFDDAAKGIEAQKRDMAKAEKFIFMEYHAIEDAESWHEIRDILAERVKAGVEVRVFYDDMGSLGFINTDFVKRTESYGIKCRVFNPFSPGLNLFLNNRDHRKITVIDGKVGYTGGYNLANEYFHIGEPYGYWKDTGVRLEGAAVQSLTVTFLEMWNAVNENDRDDKDFGRYMVRSNVDYLLSKRNRRQGLRDVREQKAEADEEKKTGKAMNLAKKIRESKTAEKIDEKIGQVLEGHAEQLAKEKEEYFEKVGEEIAPEEKYVAATSDVPESDPEGKSTGEEAGGAQPAAEEKPVHFGFVQPYADSPMDEIHVGEDVYVSVADAAQNYVWYITPYLIISDEMCHSFSMAARRGVDVRVITPGIPDKKIVYSVTRSYYNSLARNGVRMFEFTPGFCHAKMCVADDIMATCGTINLDYRSLYHHFENGCFYADCEAVADTKRDFEAMFAQCREVTEYYTHGRGAFLRFGQMLLRLVAPLM